MFRILTKHLLARSRVHSDPRSPLRHSRAQPQVGCTLAWTAPVPIGCDRLLGTSNRAMLANAAPSHCCQSIVLRVFGGAYVDSTLGLTAGRPRWAPRCRISSS